MGNAIILLVSAVVSFIVALLCEKIYLNYHAKKGKNVPDYLGEISCMFITMVLAFSMVLMNIYFEGNVWVSSGMLTIGFMLVSRMIFSVISRIECEETEKMKKGQIMVSYVISLIICMILSCFYLKSNALTLTCLSVLLGRFIWFDGELIVSKSQVVGTVKNAIRENKKILFVQGLAGGIIVLFLLLDTTIASFEFLNVAFGGCIGLGLSGVYLIIEALAKRKKYVGE